ncbi:hypothetical protein SAMN06893096_103261 [Geodermatophilus pulveris]|uniref:Uncharacterized protein n=1 Tax=Geodermatophilus pulveris TaxID=1564159 RepID=A0A239DLK3_9ACTN|nr:hypothetical protein [Geodermatophilus pulveris]SNS33326.1 hypothetical protein SAMN06893096_103261 [Geodermatophilus pulveris]
MSSTRAGTTTPVAADLTTGTVQIDPTQPATPALSGTWRPSRPDAP